MLHGINMSLLILNDAVPTWGLRLSRLYSTAGGITQAGQDVSSVHGQLISDMCVHVAVKAQEQE